jgi:signal transduction histidine kinase
VVRVRLWAADGSYNLEVGDDGPGVPLDAHERIFDRFFRVDASRSRSATSATSGAGLGLAIARWIAEAHRGTLTYVASAGDDRRGAIFAAAIPID